MAKKYKSIDDFKGAISVASHPQKRFINIDTARESKRMRHAVDTTVEELTAIAGADNRVSTFGSATGLVGEPNLTFDNTKLHINGGLAHKRRSITSSTTITTTDYYLAVSITESATLTLPSATTLTNGQTFVIKDEGGNLSDSVILTIAAPSGQTIDGTPITTLDVAHSAINIYTDGSTKYYIY